MRLLSYLKICDAKHFSLLFVVTMANNLISITGQRMQFSIENFFSKCDQIRSSRICSHLLKKWLMENFIFCAAQ